jgi:hypothetical protein
VARLGLRNRRQTDLMTLILYFIGHLLYNVWFNLVRGRVCLAFRDFSSELASGPVHSIRLIYVYMAYVKQQILQRRFFGV